MSKGGGRRLVPKGSRDQNQHLSHAERRAVVNDDAASGGSHRPERLADRSASTEQGDVDALEALCRGNREESVTPSIWKGQIWSTGCTHPPLVRQLLDRVLDSLKLLFLASRPEN